MKYLKINLNKILFEKPFVLRKTKPIFIVAYPSDTRVSKIDV